MINIIMAVTMQFSSVGCEAGGGTGLFNGHVSISRQQRNQKNLKQLREEGIECSLNCSVIR
jgi:hypothetical protein